MPRPDASDDLHARVEDAGLNASAPPQQRWADGWLLRLSPGKAKRARCIQPVALGRLPLDGKLERAAAAYRAAGLPLIARITPYSLPADLDRRLADLGWLLVDDTRVMVCADLAAALDRAGPPLFPTEHRLRSLSTDEAAETVGQLRGSPPDQREAHAQRLRHSPVRYRGWALSRGDEVLACGQIADEDDLVGLYDVHVATPARSQGLGRALCVHLLTEAARDGARHAYLQVDADNIAARAVYHRLGFIDAYAYHYRVAPTG